MEPLLMSLLIAAVVWRRDQVLVLDLESRRACAH
jgi:hypothetical protein